ncbi:MAG TPA: BrnT family toxin [Bradyrhizobium sp.]|nr:BrnT family toxin [Bradyrhizobium sp.]
MVDFDPAKEARDDRFDYGEPRYRAYGAIDGVSHCLVFTVRNDRYRPISLRRAHAKEMRRHAPES